MSEDNPDALPPANYLGDFARAYPNAKLLYRADDAFQDTGPGEADRESVDQRSGISQRAVGGSLLIV